MGRLRFTTAGESHGRGLVAVVEGLPAGLPLSAEAVDRELARRMQGYGRGARMKIEQDRVEWLAGVRAGETLGSPVAMLVWNRDWANWEDVMAAEGTPGEERRRRVARPRPGHADLAGVLKYDRRDARDVLERASARETAARVAAGAVARRLLEEVGVEIGSHVTALGGIRAAEPAAWPAPLNAAADASPVRVLDRAAEAAIMARIDAAKAAGDTLGGEVEVVALGLPVGLGSHVSWDRKLDGRLAAALMSIPAVKGVAVGLGFEAAARPGSAVHDPILSGGSAARRLGGYQRASNRAGGLEAGMTTGEPLVLRVAMKPIATLMQPLPTVHLDTGEPAQAQSERSDVTAVPAMGVIAEAMTALVLADALLEKCGGDSLGEVKRNLEGYLTALAERRSDGVSMPRHVVLIGLPGAGKSTAGRLAAEKLGAPFLDPDTLIVRRMQMPVARIFAEFGEARFRQLEHEAVEAALAGPPAILVPGGGWAAQPGHLEAARGRALVVYLKVLPTTAAARLPADHDRPLLLSEDPVARMRDLLRNREAFYDRADRTIPNDQGLPAEAADAVVRLARELAGW